MKKVIFLLGIIFLVSCQEDVDVVKLDDPGYLTKNEVTQPVEIAQEDLDVIENLKNDYDDLDVMLQINEEGGLERIIFLNKVSPEDESNIVAKLKEVEFTPAVKDKENVKFSYEIKAKKQKSGFTADQEYFVAVEEMPEPIGGIAAIQEKITYPESAKNAGIEGRIYVKAFVDENGDVTKVELIKGLDTEAFWAGNNNAGAALEEEAMRAVKETKFTPGNQRGENVKTQVSVPILFKLN